MVLALVPQIVRHRQFECFVFALPSSGCVCLFVLPSAPVHVFPFLPKVLTVETLKSDSDLKVYSYWHGVV